METLVTFGLGAGTVLIVIGVAVVSKLVRQVKELVKCVTDIQIVMNRNEEMLNLRIDQEINRVDDIYIRLDSAIDSRLDKMETRLTRGNKQVLKD
jgi:predicted PurR-regulated permease PerM